MPQRRKAAPGPPDAPARPAPAAATATGAAGAGLGERPLVERAITRALSDQYAAAAQEVARIVEATYRVIEREGTVDPRIRDILEESGLATQAFYRHFRSKDELLLVLLDDGRRRLAEYLVHRMGKASDPVGRVRAWVEGILAQASDPEASARTRPFILGLQRLAEQYPDEQRASVAVLVELLEAAIAEGVAAGDLTSADPAYDAQAVYHLAVAVMEDHVLSGTTPSRQEVAHLVAFNLRALGAAQA